MTKVVRVAMAALLATFLSFSVSAPTAAAAPPEPAEDLRIAVRRDLGMNWEDYVEAGRLAERAAALDERLAGEPGYHGVSVIGDEVVLTGTGSQVDRAAGADGVRAEEPSGRLDDSGVRERYRAEVDAAATSLFGVGWTGSGWLLTVADPGVGGVLSDGRTGISPAQFAARHPEVTVRAGELPSPQADILAGQGWGSPSIMPRCSIGFAAFAPDGRQAMLTAGHCTNEGAITEARWELDQSLSLGRLVYNQFGGAGNATNTTDTPGTDLGAYAGASPDLRAAVDGYAGAYRITGTARPVAGAPVCTSGRSTRRWQCSTIETVGPYAVQGPRGAEDLRWIEGFTTRLPSLAGDSGAGMLTGLRAVGILSAGGNYSGVEYSFGAALDPLLSTGYSLEVWLNQPRATAVAAGRVRGTVAIDDSLPANTVVRFEGGGSSTTVAADGTFSLPAPSGPSRLVAASGHSRSAVVDYDPRYGTANGPNACGLRDGGCFREWTEGFVYTSPATGSHLVKGAIHEFWTSQGWETGYLGYPTSPEMCGLTDGGCWQTYEGGRMYWSPDSGAFPIRGAIGEEWNATGYEGGSLGYPTSVEFCDLRADGCFQRYQGGSLYWSPGTGAHWVIGAIRAEWGRLGWEAGQLGYPLSGEFCDIRDGGCFQRFERGLTYWSPTTGAHPVWGAIFDHWAATGWEGGRFGYPLGAEACRTVEGERTCTQRFEGGTITWTPAGGSRG